MERDLFPFLYQENGMFFFLIQNDAWSDDSLNRRLKLVTIVNC